MKNSLLHFLKIFKETSLEWLGWQLTGLLIFVFCGGCLMLGFSLSNEIKATPPTPPPKVVHLIPYQQIQHGVSIIEIDGCEYILVIINYNIQIIHKQNCKNH